MQHSRINSCLKDKDQSSPHEAGKREQASGKNHFATFFFCPLSQEVGCAADNDGTDSGQDATNDCPYEQNNTYSHIVGSLSRSAAGGG